MSKMQAENSNYDSCSAHTFHIPVMGTGFTIDTPLKVARYGIDSVISLVDDVLLEQMRKYHCGCQDIPFEPISKKDDDSRARRITAYLNLVHMLVQRQLKELQAAPFEPGSDIMRYFDLLPDGEVKQSFNEMLATSDPAEKARLQEQLRTKVIPGKIDVNIMTKLDVDNYRDGEKLPSEFSDALAGLRGFAMSDLSASMILSAGLNQRLFAYFTQFKDFFPDQYGWLKKKITLKVSDFRSALIQGKLFAKFGLWVSEYRIESGLNCGGHAFISKGTLIGPILEEFKTKREELVNAVYSIYRKAQANNGHVEPVEPRNIRITVQGGIGTTDEDRLLHELYDVDSTGWATPFLLVPEVTNIDDAHLIKLQKVTELEVSCSDCSPLGVPFWSLMNSASEAERERRIQDGKPGSPCAKGFIKLNTEFTEKPICIASSRYQNLKLEQIAQQQLEPEKLTDVQYANAVKSILAKSCICHDLAGNATGKYGIDDKATSSICCGPAIVYFSKLVSLEQMLDHIYRKVSVFSDEKRPHMFVNELKLNVDYMRKRLDSFALGLIPSPLKAMGGFKENLLSGIQYYRSLAHHIAEDERKRFLDDLSTIYQMIERFPLHVPA